MTHENDTQEIYSLLKDKVKVADKKLIEKAYFAAQTAHKGQQRASGEPYFNHVFATAKNLATFGLDAVTIAAGFLHDTIEDTEVTEEEIREQFGDEIVFLVMGLQNWEHCATKDDSGM